MRTRSTIAALGTALAVVAGLVLAGPATTVEAATPTTAAPTTGRFTPVAPARAFSGTVGTAPVTVALGGANGIPSSATAVVLTATVTSPTAAGYVVVAPAGSSARPSVQNFSAGQQISGTTTVGLAGGKAQVQLSSGTGTVALDVAGWYGSSAIGSTYTPLPPTTVLQASVGTTPVRVPIAGTAGVPADATAVVLQTDVSRPAANGTLRITPAGNSAGVVTLTYRAGVTVANTTTVALSDGAVQARVSSGTGSVLSDVVGYYSPAFSGSVYVPADPVRAATVPASPTATNVTLTGTAGIPRNAVAAVVNAKVGGGTVGASLRVTGAGLSSAVPTQVYAAGQTIGNALIAPLSSGGKVSAKVSSGTATVYVDVVGYFLDGSTGAGTGVDVSWPQCGKTIPSDQSFGIVGVNGEFGNQPNPCFSSQLAWAGDAVGGTAQPDVQLYSLFQNPGAVQASAWPTSNTFLGTTVTGSPYGTCTPAAGGAGQTTRACSYVYGYGRAATNVGFSGLSTPGQYRWWLDVETGLSHQTDVTQNRAALEGMIAAYRKAGITDLGLYSTGLQFQQVMGSVPTTGADGRASTIRPLPSWIALGPTTLASAQAACSGTPLVDGPIRMTQYVSSFAGAEIDRDWSCS
ncbi:hypothetical protein ACWGJ9_05135 [Curtobacterium citreum]